MIFPFVNDRFYKKFREHGNVANPLVNCDSHIILLPLRNFKYSASMLTQVFWNGSDRLRRMGKFRTTCSPQILPVDALPAIAVPRTPGTPVNGKDHIYLLSKRSG